MRWVGIDVGGTFTDVVVYDGETGTWSLGKVPSTPADPTRGVLDGLAKLGVESGTTARIVHGMTIGTNAILEKKGAEVWVLTSAGFGDCLEIQRTNRATLYDIKTLKPASLVAQQHVLELGERLMFDGSVLHPLDEAEVRSAVRAIDGTARAVAVCLLHSYVNPAHERATAAILTRDRPDLYVSTSSDVLPELREYERFTTTVLNAYIGPLVGGYLRSLAGALEARGHGGALLIVTSSGGVASPERAARFPVHTVLSGPAGGVAAAVHVGAHLGLRNVITYDMGGTSTDVCLIEDLAPPLTSEQTIAGYPNRTPQIEINSVGAGGGSIAWLDAGGILKVGPRSAGAVPGPACYGRGGTEPTVSDANLVLHRLRPGARLGASQSFPRSAPASPGRDERGGVWGAMSGPPISLAGEIAVDEERAADVIDALAARLNGLDRFRLAEGIVQIAVARMVSAIKEISIARGFDPRDFALLAYGGAGPMHAALIAAELEIPRVIVPPGPGNFSALGSLISDLRHDQVRTRRLDVRQTPLAEVLATFGEMESEARARLAGEGIAPDDMVTERALGMRYVGQSWELGVRVPDTLDSIDALETLFSQAHERRYGWSHEGPAEVVSFRLTAIGRVAKPSLPTVRADGTPDAARAELRDVYFDGAWLPAPVYERGRLPAGAPVAGPALVDEMGAVTVVPPGWHGVVGHLGEITLTRSSR
jgi:N-methylhydantoinase A